MKADRSLVGVIAIALVISTVITMFIVGEGGGPYSVIKSEYGGSGPGRWLVGISLLAKEPIATLKVSPYGFVRRQECLAGIDLDGTPQEVMARIPSLRSYLDMAAAVNMEPIVRPLDIVVPRYQDEKTLLQEEFHAYIYDFSELVWQAVPDELMYSTERPVFGRGHLWDFYNAFACLFDEDGNLTYFYQGVADFFVSKVIIIDELSIQRNEEKTTYYGVTKEDTADEARSIVYAPDRGVVTFEDLERNDRVGVVYSLDTNKLPLNPGGMSSISFYTVMHIFETRTDEAEAEYIVSMHDPPRPQPKS